MSRQKPSSGRRTGSYSTDLAVKIDLIHEKLKDRITEAKRAIPSFADISNKQYALECGASRWVNRHSSGLPFDKLLDIKLLFEDPRTGDQKGFPEEEFIRVFADIFCPSSEPAQVRKWFFELDNDANGVVDWDEFSSHMMAVQHGESGDQPSIYTAKGIEPESHPTNLSQISRVACNANANEYYTAGVDGNVRAWDSVTLCDKGIFHYSDGYLVHTLLFIPETNRLIVAQYNRITFIYHCAAKLGGKLGCGIRLERAFKGETLLMHKPAFSRVLRTCEYDPESSIMDSGGVSQKIPFGKCGPLGGGKSGGPAAGAKRLSRHYIDVVLMDDLDKTALCVEGMHHLFAPDRHPDPFLFGLESGAVQLYSLTGKGNKTTTLNSGGSFEAGTRIKSIETWQVHHDWVTQILAAPELQGFISSSLDASLQVFDVVKGETYIRMACGTDGEGTRGVHNFDYSVARNLLCSCGISRDATLWNPKARQRMCTLGDHRAPLISVKFVDSANQLLTLSEDKTVKIWDVRTFRCVQVLIDKERRYPEDKYMALSYDMKGDAIVTCAGVPIVWRDVNTQARLETGTVWHAGYNGHLCPVISCLYSPDVQQLTTLDQSCVRVWDVRTGGIVHTWSPEECTESQRRITTSCLDSDGRRLLIGFDGGDVQLYAFDGRPLKKFESDARYEITSLIYTRLHEGSSTPAVFVVAAGFGKKIILWPDQPIPLSAHAIAVGKGATYLPTQGHHVYSIDICPPSKLAAGVANGSVLIYNLNNMTLLSVNKHTFGIGGSFVRALMKDDEDGFAGPGCPPLRGAFDADSMSDDSPMRGRQPPWRGRSPSDNAGGGDVVETLDPSRRRSRLMWKGMLDLGRTEETLGATSFTKFRNNVQSKLLAVAEALIYVSQDVLVTLHGDGDALVWRHKDGHYLEILARFPASFSSGEVAYAVAYDAAECRLFTGDCDAVVSVFDMFGALAPQGGSAMVPDVAGESQVDQRAQSAKHRSLVGGGRKGTHTTKIRIRKRDSFGVNSQRPQHNTCRVKLVACFNLQLAGVVTQLRVLPDSTLLLVGSNDCSVTLVHRQTGQIFTQLGATSHYPQSWPQGLPGSLDMPAVPIPAEPKRHETLFLRQHRFCVAFPEDVVNATPIDSFEALRGEGAGGGGEGGAGDAGAAGPPPPSPPHRRVLPALRTAPVLEVSDGALLDGAEDSQTGSPFHSIPQQSPRLLLDDSLIGSATEPAGLGSLSTALPSADHGKKRHSTTIDNSAMYQRYVERRKDAAPAQLPQSVAPSAIDVLGQARSGVLETQLKDMQQRKKQRGPTKRFAYTTVRHMRGVNKPCFLYPRCRDQCLCTHCKGVKAKDIDQSSRTVQTLPVF